MSDEDHGQRHSQASEHQQAVVFTRFNFVTVGSDLVKFQELLLRDDAVGLKEMLVVVECPLVSPPEERELLFSRLLQLLFVLHELPALLEQLLHLRSQLELGTVEFVFAHRFWALHPLADEVERIGPKSSGQEETKHEPAEEAHHGDDVNLESDRDLQMSLDRLAQHILHGHVSCCVNEGTYGRASIACMRRHRDVGILHICEGGEEEQ